MSAKIIPVPAFDYVVFGGTGDLTLRKLMPALYYRFRDGQIPPESRIIAVSRASLDDAGYVAEIESACRAHVAAPDFDPELFARFAARLSYVTLDATFAEGWSDLTGRLANEAGRPRVFYLATSPDLFGPICRSLGREGLVTPESRVVLEKPLGHNLASARRIHDEVGAIFDEAQIFRIDHYLGKESVQNLLLLRFANSLFEPVWNRAHIDNVQITVAETVGPRGARRLLRPLRRAPRHGPEPHAPAPDAGRHGAADLDGGGLEPGREAEGPELAEAPHQRRGAPEDRARPVQGRRIDGRVVKGCLDELGHPSRTETFVAVKAEVDDWRWNGVPFYLRSGKRLPARLSEIVIEFKRVPHSIFDDSVGRLSPNRLVVRLQPDDGISLELMAKDPGPSGMRLRPAPLNVSFADTFKVRYPDAYERLLMDVVRGNPTLFMRRDEVEAAWRWAEPILESWAGAEDAPKPYMAGSWDPTAATALIERDGRTWYEDTI